MIKKPNSHNKNTEIETIKIPVSDLRLGMFISELDRPWLETPFPFQGFEVRTWDEILTLQDLCKHVYIDQTRTRKTDLDQAMRATPQRGKPVHTHVSGPFRAMDKEMGRAKSAQQHTSSLLNSFFIEIKNGRSLDIQLARSAVSDCVSSIMRNSEAMTLLTQIKDKDEYTSQHSFNVCVYSVLLGRQLGLQTRELEDLGLCGLLHDMGKIRVPLEVLNKDHGLTRDEVSIMQSHTVHGMEILSSGRSIFNGTVEAAYGHHENMDGSGYPRGLKGFQTSLFTRIVSVVDKYDAITSNRVYRSGRTHLEAVAILQQLSKKHIDSELATAFIASLGTYPAGCVVELSSGEVAVVIEHNPLYQLRPRVIVCLDPHKRPMPERFVDLAERQFDHAGNPYSIRRLHRPDAFGIDLSRIRELVNKPVW